MYMQIFKNRNWDGFYILIIFKKRIYKNIF